MMLIMYLNYIISNGTLRLGCVDNMSGPISSAHVGGAVSLRRGGARLPDAGSLARARARAWDRSRLVGGQSLADGDQAVDEGTASGLGRAARLRDGSLVRARFGTPGLSPGRGHDTPDLRTGRAHASRAAVDALDRDPALGGDGHLRRLGD